MLLSDKDFLAQAGLPRTAAIPTGGAGDFALLPAEAQLMQGAKYPLLYQYKASYLLFGFVKYEPAFGHDTYFCTEKKSGAVWMVDNQDANVYYVNSSISAFAESLLAYRSFAKPDEDDPLKDDDSRRLRSLKREIKAFDPKAMAKRANYWPIMLADLADQI